MANFFEMDDIVKFKEQIEENGIDGQMNWNLHSIIAINEIQSIKTKEGIFSCNLIIKTDEEIQINFIGIPIAQEIVVYINDLIAKNYRNSIENILK